MTQRVGGDSVSERMSLRQFLAGISPIRLVVLLSFLPRKYDGKHIRNIAAI